MRFSSWIWQIMTRTSKVLSMGISSLVAKTAKSRIRYTSRRSVTCSYLAPKPRRKRHSQGGDTRRHQWIQETRCCITLITSVQILQSEKYILADFDDFTSLEMSKSSEICSPAPSHSEQPWTAQLYAVLQSHDTSFRITVIAFCVAAASVKDLASSTWVTDPQDSPYSHLFGIVWPRCRLMKALNTVTWVILSQISIRHWLMGGRLDKYSQKKLDYASNQCHGFWYACPIWLRPESLQ